ncbi:MAG: hypothetical protein AB7U83_14115 [Vicinamibacterales bacterium]
MMLPLLLAGATTVLSAQAPPTPPLPPTPTVPAVPAAPPVPAVPVTLQTPPTPPTPPEPPAPQPPQPPRAMRVPTPPPPPGKPGQNVNVRIELTITESGSGAPQTKVVSLIASDANWGRVRSTGAARPNPTADFGSVVLNVDARPTLLSGDSLRLELTVEYVPPMAEATPGADVQRPARLHQSLNVIVKSGQSLQVSRAVDPVSNRTTTVDVTATPLP